MAVVERGCLVRRNKEEKKYNLLSYLSEKNVPWKCTTAKFKTQELQLGKDTIYYSHLIEVLFTEFKDSCDTKQQIEHQFGKIKAGELFARSTYRQTTRGSDIKSDGFNEASIHAGGMNSTANSKYLREIILDYHMDLFENIIQYDYVVEMIPIIGTRIQKSHQKLHNILLARKKLYHREMDRLISLGITYMEVVGHLRYFDTYLTNELIKMDDFSNTFDEILMDQQGHNDVIN